jgi:hypothetical protein
MPTYDYHCPANGRTVEVSHKLADRVRTWGDLCRRAGLPLAGTPAGATVERLITGGSLIGSLGSDKERPCDSGPCGPPVCGSGACSYD